MLNRLGLFFSMLLMGAAILDGCSSPASSPTSNFVLQMLSSNKAGNVVSFNLKVTNNSQPVKGAKLTELLLFNNQHDTTETLNIFSDSLGMYSFSTTFPGTTLSVGFRAIYDSLVSNYVTCP